MHRRAATRAEAFEGDILADMQGAVFRGIGAYAHFHAAIMETLIVEKADQKHRYMQAVLFEALDAFEVALKPGQPMGGS